jgi:hypothetical protein
VGHLAKRHWTTPSGRNFEPSNAAQASPRKANLFVVGAPKCGTTAWVEYLRAHPNIFFPNTKEDCFFALDLPKFRFIHSEAEYSKLFADSGNAKFVGEASAMYLFSKAAAKAIRDYNADAKILIFLREQEEFLPSLHNQYLREFSEEIQDFEAVWKLSGNRPPETVPPACLEPRTLDYAAMGRFSEQVGRYLTAFPAAQVRVIRFHDWIADPRAAYLEILDFLGLDDDRRSEFPRINEGVTYRSRRLVRFILFPPLFARKAARLVKRLTGLQGLKIYPAVKKMVNLLSATGYKKEIDRKLSEEIRRYYAEDNRLLEEQLRRARDGDSRAAATTGISPGVRQEVRSEIRVGLNR